MHWQKRGRLVVGLFGLGCAAAVYLSIGERPDPVASAPPERTDPAAMIESTGNVVQQVRGLRQEYLVEAERQLTYEGGAATLFGVTVTLRERAGRDFVISGRQARTGRDQRTLELTGDVHMVGSDGFEMRAEEASFTADDGMVRVPGAVTFGRGLLSGSGTDVSYDQLHDLLVIAHASRVKLEREDGGVATEFTSDGAEFDRTMHQLRLSGGVDTQREDHALSSTRLVAVLGDDDSRLSSMSLRGNSRVTATTGALERLVARDIDLGYREDGDTIELARLTGDASAELRADGGHAARALTGEMIYFEFAPDGQPTRAEATGGMRMVLPGGAPGADRVVSARQFDATGRAGDGLTDARFEDDVVYTEGRRQVRAGALTMTLTPAGVGMARFSGDVAVEDGSVHTTSPVAEYDPDAGRLRLTGTGRARPRVSETSADIEADVVDVALDTRRIRATGRSVTTLRGGGNAGGPGTTLPGLLAPDTPVTVTADGAVYDGSDAGATFTGRATLRQGETAIRAEQITLDRANGALTASGDARSTLRLDDGVTSGRAATIRYDDASRRVTYTSAPPVPITGLAAASGGPAAQVSGPQGDLTAGRIDLVLAPGGGGAEQLEATDRVRVVLDSRVATGGSMIYRAAEGRYEMTGTPVRVVEQCRETVGRSLIFFRTTDRIVVDGNEQVRTRSTGSDACQEPPRP